MVDGMNHSSQNPPDVRRTMVLVIAIVLLAIFAVAKWRFGEEGSVRFLTAATGRVGLVMGAVWLAWPSLKKPARWLPPGIAMAGVIGLAVIAVRPTLILVVVPAIGTLAALTMFIRGLK